MEEKEKKIIPEKTALSRMMRICSRKEYCTFDIRQKLKQLNQSDETTEKILTQLQKNKFIDDTRYTSSYINDKLRFSKWGKTKIVYMLRRKQISEEIIETVFSEISSDLLTASLKPLLKKKLKSVKGTSNYDKRNKIIRYGLGRGFAMSDVIECLDRLMSESEEE